MADTNANRQCRVCGIAFFQPDGPGRKALYCGRACRQGNKGVRVHTHKGKRIGKACEWCGSLMALKPAEANERRYCSIGCAGKGTVRDKGLTLKRTTFTCCGCHKEVHRRASSGTDALKFCTKECSFLPRRAVSREVEALRRIAKAWKRKPPSCVAKEVEALHRIARHKERRIRRPCDACSSVLVRSGQGRRLCVTCGQEAYRAAKKRNRANPVSRMHKRAYKSARRAVIRGTEVERIDPLVVFERDGWACYLCGEATPKSLRGASDPKAPELEHVIPLAKGGTHTWDNVRCACRQCNALKGVSLAA